MGKLFGTDGIRGVANQYPLTPEMAVNMGRAIVSNFRGNRRHPLIVIGKDTRISGTMIEYAIASGICSAGGHAYFSGVLPTPAVAYVASQADAIAGIVISASHNPFYDNGIKVFDGQGYKLKDDLEKQIEDMVLDDSIPDACRSIRDTGQVFFLDDAGQRYKVFLRQCIEKASFKAIKIVLDCSNGATFKVAPELFQELGADVESLSVNPDGKNINAGCGSEHPQGLVRRVLETRADIGLAFDGDGDRLIAVDEKGQVISGDCILAICANALKKNGALKNNIVVSTVMSNLGLGVALKQMGIKHVMTRVGDRYVLEQMLAHDAVIGGEDSGHMIFLDRHTTGDGILAALRLVEVMQRACAPLSELSQIMKVFPQVLINVEVRCKPDLEKVPEIVDAIRSVEADLGEEGRVLVRYSGTQPLCRVMVEGPNDHTTQNYCRQIADVVQKKIGND